MFYVLFTYSKGHKEKDFRKFRSEEDLIDFLHKKYEEIDIVQILAANKIFRLGLVETEEFIKSELVLDDDKDPFPEGKTEEDIDKETELTESEKESKFLRSRRHASLKNKKEEPSAMSKIADDIEKEMTEEEIIKKNKEALNRADNAIVAAEKDLEKTTGFIPKPVVESIKRSYRKRESDKTDWPTCPECGKNKMAPWNKSDRCSECQQYKKIPKKK